MSIFIWKAEDSEYASSHTITLHIGSSWSIESAPHHHASYEWVGQRVCEDVVVYFVDQRPRDWTGHLLLEQQTLPYQKLKEDTDGNVYERVGGWFRVRTKNEVEDDPLTLSSECKRIKEAMTILINKG